MPRASSRRTQRDPWSVPSSRGLSSPLRLETHPGVFQIGTCSPVGAPGPRAVTEPGAQYVSLSKSPPPSRDMPCTVRRWSTVCTALSAALDY